MMPVGQTGGEGAVLSPVLLRTNLMMSAQLHENLRILLGEKPDAALGGGLGAQKL